jgi:hypothetical protein
MLLVSGWGLGHMRRIQKLMPQRTKLQQHQREEKSIGRNPHQRRFAVLVNKGMNWLIHLVSLVVQEVDTMDESVLDVVEEEENERTCMVEPL